MEAILESLLRLEHREKVQGQQARILVVRDLGKDFLVEQADKHMGNFIQQEKRRQFYKQFCPFWYDLADEPYALYDVLYFSQADLLRIQQAATAIIHVYHKTAGLLQQMKSDTYRDLGFPKAAFPFLSHTTLSVPSIIQRLDMVPEGTKWKHYELNSDTPTFIMECYQINDQVAKHFGYLPINDGKKQELVQIISAAIQESLAICGFSQTNAKIVFTAHRESVEDWETTCYLAGLFSNLSPEVLALNDLRIVTGEGLYTPKGERIHLLYRQTYPLEFLMQDQDEKTGEAVGVELLHLVLQKKLAICNPISAFLLQSKAVQALIWGLHEMGHTCYTEAEHQMIQDHFLPTYLDADYFLSTRIPYVKKPVFGREGAAVQIYQGDCNNHAQQFGDYDKQLKVYQKFVSSPQKEIQSPVGRCMAHILVGCFVIGNQVGAMGARAGNLITRNESYFLPIGTK